MTRQMTLADQRVALAALAQLSAAFGHLPGAHIGLNTIFPDRVDISLHDGLHDFEPWREALGIPAQDVQIQSRSTAMNLKAVTTFAGATVELVGYADPLPARGAA